MNARWLSDNRIVEDALNRLRDERVAGRIEIVMDEHGVLIALDAFPDTHRRREYRIQRVDRRALNAVQSK